jgi:hypothetical protein
MKRRAFLAVSLVLLLPVAAKAAEPTLSFEPEAVVADGLQPKATIVWFGVERMIDDSFSATVAEHFEVQQATENGTATLNLERPLDEHSMWVAVDLGSGASVVAAPASYRVASALRPGRLQNNNPSDEITDHRSAIVGLMVRPAEGAWVIAGGDGGPRDEDGVTNGSLTLALDAFDPLGDSPAAPAKIGKDDLWFIVDPVRMELSVYRGGEIQ